MNSDLLLGHFDRIGDTPEAVPRLRRFVLDLAVHGKLIDQSPSDELSTALLTRNDQARRVIAETDRRADANKKLLLAAESRWAIPPSWSWSALADLVLFIDYRGKTPTKTEKGVRLITAKNVKKGLINVFPEEFLSEPDYRAWMTRGLPQEGDILFTTEAPMGNAAVVRGRERFALAQRLICFRPYGALNSDFLTYYLISEPFQFILAKTGTGLTAKGIKAAKLARLPVAIPPLAEQCRIVTRVNELMALCDRLEAARAEREARRDRLTAASLHRLNNCVDANAFRDHANFCLAHIPLLTASPSQIKHLRQTVLNLAIRGLLVPQDPKDEFAAEFLGERRLIPNSDSWKLPSGWAWSSFSLIGETLGGGTPSKAHPEFWKGSVPWVSPKDMKVDVITDSQDHISTAAVEQSAVRLIPTGSLLMVVRGMILAHSFPTASTAVPVTINQDMKAIVPFRADLIRFLVLLTKGLKPEVLKLVLRSTHGTCKLLTDDLFSLPIPIPPLAEQRRILAKVTELMAICDRLETTLSVKRGYTGRLLEAVLHSALPTAGTPRDGLDGFEMNVMSAPPSAVLTS